MALTKTETVDKVEVVEMEAWSMVQVRTVTIIKEDDTELSRSYNRHVVSPADDWTNESDKVKPFFSGVPIVKPKPPLEPGKDNQG